MRRCLLNKSFDIVLYEDPIQYSCVIVERMNMRHKPAMRQIHMAQKAQLYACLLVNDITHVHHRREFPTKDSDYKANNEARGFETSWKGFKKSMDVA